MLSKVTSADGVSRWLWKSDSDASWTAVTFEDGIGRLTENRGSIRPASYIHEHIELPSGVDAPFGGTKIVCVGRNYRPHADELGNEVPKQPLWFMKPPSSLAAPGGDIRLPAGHGRIDYEGELALVIGRRTTAVSRDQALDCIAGVTLALDVTARELQKIDGQWTRAKGFDTFCPLGPIILPFGAWAADLRLSTELNGRTVQDDRTSSLVFSYADLIAHLSACMTLMPGDVILTGTPAGVGPLANGDSISVAVSGQTVGSEPEARIMSLEMRVSTFIDYR